MIKNQHDSSDPDPLFVWWFRWWLIKQFDHTIWQKSQWKNAKKSGSQIDPRKTTGDSFLKVSPLLRGLLYITLSRIQLQSNSLAKVTSVQSSIGILTLRSLINLIPRDSGKWETESASICTRSSISLFKHIDSTATCFTNPVCGENFSTLKKLVITKRENSF